MDAPVQLDRRPLGKRIAEALRHEIIFGRLRPGTALPQEEICRRFGTSRMPARDAINILEMEGFIARPNGKDAEVAQITPRDIMDAFEVQATLHGLAAAWAAERATAPQLERLRVLNDGMRAAAERGEIAEAAHLNGSFHRQLNRMSGSSAVIAVLRPISAFIPDDFVAEVPEWALRGAKEHNSIIEAIEAGALDEVRRLVSAHVLHVGEELRRLLETR